jgi:hypothetical protein
MKQPYNNAHVNLGKRSHSHDTNIIKPVTNSKKKKKKNCILKTPEYFK